MAGEGFTSRKAQIEDAVEAMRPRLSETLNLSLGDAGREVDLSMCVLSDPPPRLCNDTHGGEKEFAVWHWHVALVGVSCRA